MRRGRQRNRPRSSMVSPHRWPARSSGGRHTLNLIRGVPSSREGRRSGTEIRALIAELGGARRDLTALHRGMRAARTPAARGVVGLQQRLRRQRPAVLAGPGRQAGPVPHQPDLDLVEVRMPCSPGQARNGSTVRSYQSRGRCWARAARPAAPAGSADTPPRSPAGCGTRPAASTTTLQERCPPVVLPLPARCPEYGRRASRTRGRPSL